MRRAGRRGRLGLERLLIVLGILLMVTAGAFVGYAKVSEQLGEREWDRMLEQTAQVEPAPRPVRPAPREGDLLGRIELPRLGLMALVHHGVRESTLLQGAGHVPGTRLPGESGNVALAAHRDMHFRKLREVREGDLIRLLTLEGERRYRVAEIDITRPEDVSSLAPTTDDRLTLVTCYPFNYVGRAPKRFVVSAVASDAGVAAGGDLTAQPR